MKNFAEVIPNLYRGSAPNSEELDVLCSLFKIQKVISLDDFTGQIVKVLNHDRFEHLFLPLNASAEKLDKNYFLLYHQIEDLLTPTVPTFVHCRHGQDRTGLAVALFRITKQKWPAKQAYQEGRKFGFCNGVDKPTRKFFIQLLKNKEQDNFDSSQVDDQTFQEYERFSPPLTSIMQLTSIPHQDPIYRVPENPNDVLEGREFGYYNIPTMGVNPGTGPLPGAGPVENSGVMNFR